MQKQEYLFTSNDVAYEVYWLPYSSAINGERTDKWTYWDEIKYKDIYESKAQNSILDGSTLELKVTKKIFNFFAIANNKRNYTWILKRKRTSLSDGYDDIFYFTGMTKIFKSEDNADVFEYYLYLVDFNLFVLKNVIATNTNEYPYNPEIEEPYNWNKVYYNTNFKTFIKDILERNIFNPIAVAPPYNTVGQSPTRKLRGFNRVLNDLTGVTQKVNINVDRQSLLDVITKILKDFDKIPKLKFKLIDDKISIYLVLENEVFIDKFSAKIVNYKEEYDFLNALNSAVAIKSEYPNEYINQTTMSRSGGPRLTRSDKITDVNVELPNSLENNDENFEIAIRKIKDTINDNKFIENRTIELVFLNKFYAKDIKVGTILNFSNDFNLIGGSKFRINKISEFFSKEENYLLFIIDEMEELFLEEKNYEVDLEPAKEEDEF